MKYNRFQETAFPFFIFTIFLCIFCIIITIQMYRKWIERKVKAPLHLSFVFTFLSLSLISLTIGLAEAAITGYYKEIYRFCLPFSFSMLVLANVFLYVFTSEITQKGKKAVVPLIIIALIIIVIIYLPWNWWGVPTELHKGKLDIRLYTTLSITIYSLVVILSIAMLSIKMKKNVKDNIARVGASLLFYASMSMIGFFVFIIIENALIFFFAIEGFSIFMYLAWIFAMLFFILSYLSLVMPNWLINLIEKNKT